MKEHIHKTLISIEQKNMIISSYVTQYCYSTGTTKYIGTLIPTLAPLAIVKAMGKCLHKQVITIYLRNYNPYLYRCWRVNFEYASPSNVAGCTWIFLAKLFIFCECVSVCWGWGSPPAGDAVGTVASLTPPRGSCYLPNPSSGLKSPCYGLISPILPPNDS